MWAHIESDCVIALRQLEDNSIDSIVTDPPYALSFMGKDWDSFGDGKGYQAWCEDWAGECLRVLKPGGQMLAFGGTRTYHRLTCAIEDAGFYIRDSLHWIYGSGFPKSLDVSKAIDKAAGAEREVIGSKLGLPGYSLAESKGQLYEGSFGGSGDPEKECAVTAPSTEAAKQWQGWGTALKPAHEPIVLARKPLDNKNTVAANVLEHGTGALNIDACRVSANPEGRWPPNILLSHSPYCVNIRLKRSDNPGAWDCSESCPIAEMDRQSGNINSPGKYIRSTDVTNKTDYGKGMGVKNKGAEHQGYGDSGGASRFFPEAEWDDLAREYFRYQSKAAKKERPVVDGKSHSTVKPVALMRWLVKLITPPNGLVVDPFAGTGPTAEACILEGFNCLLIDDDPMSVKWCDKRMEKYADQKA